MTSYVSKIFINKHGYIEIPESEYTEHQKDMKTYVNILSDAIVKAKCGWGEVKYKVMSYHEKSEKYIEESDEYIEEFEEYIEEFMVLCADGEEKRWIPITGNSKACNLDLLGDNLW